MEIKILGAEAQPLGADIEILGAAAQRRSVVVGCGHQKEKSWRTVAPQDVRKDDILELSTTHSALYTKSTIKVKVSYF